MNNCPSIITLNVNGVNDPNKRHRLAEWLQKEDPVSAVYRRPTSEAETHAGCKWGDGKRYSTQTEAWGKLVAILTSDKTIWRLLRETEEDTT